MGASGTATLSFGPSGNTTATVAVADASILAGSRVEAWIEIPANDTARMRDEYWVESLRVYAGSVVAGVGFTIYGICDVSKALGDFTVAWVWN